MDRPTILKTQSDRANGHACAASPVAEAQGYSVARQPAIGRSISHLFGYRSPSAIGRFVMTVNVDPVKAITRWTSAHVCKKSGIVVPACANADTASAVPVEIMRGRTATTLKHCFPSAIFTLGVISGRVAVARVFSRHQVSTQAPTASSSTASKIGCAAFHDRAACASATPDITMRSSFGCCFYHGQAAKRMADQIETSARFIYSHAVSFSIGDGVVRGWRTVITSACLANYPTVEALL